MSKISWSKALVDYLKNETESYASIAKKYDISLQAVKKRAGKEMWQDLRQKTIQKVNQRLPEITGEDVAMIDARQAQMGKMMQYIGLKAIIDNRLAPENFTQAKEAIKDGAKIERQAVGAGAEERKKTGLFNIIDRTRREYELDDDSEETKRNISLVTALGQKPIQIAPSTPDVDLQLLAKIQEELLRMGEKLDEAKDNLKTTKGTQNNATNSTFSGWF